MSRSSHLRTDASTSTTDAVSEPLCDGCGSLRFPEGDVWRCGTCGASTPKRDTAAFVTTRRQDVRTITVRGATTERGLPTTEADCPECESDEAYWDIKQLRSSDEAPTELYICTNCSHTWRRD